MFGEIPTNLAIIDSQIEGFKSDNFALSVVRNLHLAQDPEFVGSNQGPIGSAIDQLLHPFAPNKPKTETTNGF